MALQEVSSGTQSLAPAILKEPKSGRLQINNILCPVDFSDFSLKAVNYSTCIARHFRSRLFLQHVVHLPPSSYFGGGKSLATQAMLQSELRRTGAEMRRLAAVPRLQLPEVHMVVNDGDICDCLHQTIEENQIDLVVMGTHARKGFDRLMLGSVTERIVHEAVGPVLVVGRPVRDFIAPEEPQPVHLKTILLATDFSTNSSRALAQALKWAAEWSAKVLLFHAVEEVPPETKGRIDLFPEYNPYFEQQLVEAWKTIHEQVPQDASRMCEISSEVRHGNPREQILQFAEEKNADLIGMGSRAMGKTATIWGSTISGVLRDGRFPVLAVPRLPA